MLKLKYDSFQSEHWNLVLNFQNNPDIFLYLVTLHLPYISRCHTAPPTAYLSLLLSDATSLLSVSLASLASSSSLCSFLRAAATRCASSSASSSWCFSCFTRTFPFSACTEREREREGNDSERPWRFLRTLSRVLPGLCTAAPASSHPPSGRSNPSASSLSDAGSWRWPGALCATSFTQNHHVIS